ncbi:uncharacterized protein TRAVEDRAFT_20360 [Trametes versicolor FP-101664 SS1]|uniref:uncharacterized protein n=1 Tax=Trametes versicolor (strain FP-101664) TaxID=717944 RepID=UPI0004623847|nr:uncharacterized protein TRAVEDRAFT_20360 [Trametes versicolor FP-101664 SS1]EIW58315.1 hypothetical protein TRAVEDRAFT_20360 [Trametes versicolor FP-101664 SS1]
MFTPEGVRLDVLCIDLAQYPKISDIAIRYTEHNTWLDAYAVDHCLQRGRTRSLAVLRCKDGVGRLMAIPLFHPTSSSSNATSSSGKQHGVSIATHMRCSSSCAGNPSFRLIRLSAFALETIRDRHLLSRQPATVFFLHNSGSEIFSALPALRSNYIDLSEKLWDKRSMTRSGPSDSDSESPQPPTPSQRVQLAPACEEELLLLGFQVSPLTFVCSRGQNEVLVETVLSSGLLEGTSREPFRQHIRIKLVISRPAGVFGSLRLQLSVANNFHFPPEQDHTGLEGDVQEGSPIDLWKIAAADICAFDFQPPLCTIVDAPSADSASRDGSRTLSVSQYVTKTRRTIVRTQHIIHGYWNRQYTRWMHLLDKHVVRDMRLALECPWEAFDENASPGTPVLWLSVELSEAYRMASDVRLQLESRDTW